MGEVIDFAKYKENRGNPHPVIEGSATSEVECTLGHCRTCGAPAYAFPDFEEPEFVSFAPEEIELYAQELTSEQQEAIKNLLNEADKMNAECARIMDMHGAVSVKLSEIQLHLENERLVAVLSELVEAPNEEIRQRARELLNGRDKE